MILIYTCNNIQKVKDFVKLLIAQLFLFHCILEADRSANLPVHQNMSWVKTLAQPIFCKQC